LKPIALADFLPMTLRPRQAGFTLPEMMIAVVIMAIGLSMALPGFQRMVAGQRLSASTNDMLSVINYARMEAIRVRGRVVACPSRDGNSCDTGTDWSSGMVFIDSNRDGSRSSSETIGRRWDFRNSNLTMTQTAGSSPPRVVFGASGLAQPGVAGAAMTPLRICANGLAQKNTMVSIQAGGARSSKGNGNGCS
jgi:type IV fimbrial biogenesis protein FimT